MANQNGGSLHCVAIRVTALKSDGSHANQPMYVTDNLVKIDFNPELEAGQEVADKNAAGIVYVSYRLQDVIKRYTVNLETVTNDPELEVILTGGTTYTSGGSGSVNVKGYQYGALGQFTSPYGVSVEAWTHNIVAGVINPTQPYQRWVLPRLYLVKGNRTIDINRLASPFSGFATENPNWGAGPAGDFPFDSTKAVQWMYDTAYPTPQIGTQTTTQ
jgi:hypothetical protein